MLERGSPRLGANASRAFDEAEQSNAVMFVPAITVAEVYFAINNIFCHRCETLQPICGSISASIESASGERLTHYLCAACCLNLAAKEGDG